MQYGKEQSGGWLQRNFALLLSAKQQLGGKNKPHPFSKSRPLGLRSSWCIPHSNIAPPLCSLSITVGDTSAKTVNFPQSKVSLFS